MNRKLTFTSALVVAALSVATVPAGAQGQRNNGRERGGGRATASAPAARQDGGRQAAPRQAQREAAPQARQGESRSTAPRQYSAPQAAPRANENRQYSAPQAVPRSYGNRSYSGPQAMPRGSGDRQYGSPQAMPRQYGNRQYGSPQAVPRSYNRPSYQSPSYRYNDRRGYAQGRYGEFYSRPHFYSRLYSRPYNYSPYRPFYFSRPYYSFRPWLDFGFGLWLGYSVPYPYTYLGDYRPRVYGYYPEGGYDVSAGASVYGGVSFDIQPSDADLFVDGEYVGTIGTFTPNAEPLTLTPGVHRIAVQHEGFRSMEWDVTIEPGQVVPYRGVMERY